MRKVPQAGEAEKNEYCIRRNIPARGVAKEPDQLCGDRNREQNKKSCDSGRGELAKQRTLKNHLLL